MLCAKRLDGLQKAQSQPAEGSSGTAHAALEIGAVECPGSSSGVAIHAVSVARFVHLKDIFAQKETTKTATTEGDQGEMRDHFNPKEQGWTTEQDNAWKEKLAEVITEKYLPISIVDTLPTHEWLCDTQGLS